MKDDGKDAPGDNESDASPEISNSISNSMSSDSISSDSIDSNVASENGSKSFSTTDNRRNHTMSELESHSSKQDASSNISHSEHTDRNEYPTALQQSSKSMNQTDESGDSIDLASGHALTSIQSPRDSKSLRNAPPVSKINTKNLHHTIEISKSAIKSPNLLKTLEREGDSKSMINGNGILGKNMPQISPLLVHSDMSSASQSGSTDENSSNVSLSPLMKDDVAPFSKELEHELQLRAENEKTKLIQDSTNANPSDKSTSSSYSKLNTHLQKENLGQTNHTSNEHSKNIHSTPDPQIVKSNTTAINKRKCSICAQKKSKNEFSNKQWKLGENTRKCRQCTAR